MNTTENNKLIAEFMEWDEGIYQLKVTNPKHPEYNKPQPEIEVFLLEDSHPIVESMYTDCPGYNWDHEKEDSDGYTIRRLMFFHEDLLFHSSWEWLMPVISVINNLGICYNDSGFNLIEVVHNCMLDTDIASTHEAVVQFIKWYNENKK